MLRVHLYEGLVRHRWELLWHIEATVLRETLQDAFGEAQFRRDPTGADVSHIFAARPSDVAIRMYLSIYLDTRARYTTHQSLDLECTWDKKGQTAMKQIFCVGAVLLMSHQCAAEKDVGIYYWTWFPDAWSFGAWGTPQLGYYRSDDTNIIDQHCEQLVSAGIDFVLIDWSNNCLPYGDPNNPKLLRDLHEVVCPAPLREKDSRQGLPAVRDYVGDMRECQLHH